MSDFSSLNNKKNKETKRQQPPTNHSVTKEILSWLVIIIVFVLIVQIFYIAPKEAAREKVLDSLRQVVEPTVEDKELEKIIAEQKALEDAFFTDLGGAEALDATQINLDIFLDRTVQEYLDGITVQDYPLNGEFQSVPSPVSDMLTDLQDGDDSVFKALFEQSQIDELQTKLASRILQTKQRCYENFSLDNLNPDLQESYPFYLVAPYLQCSYIQNQFTTIEQCGSFVGAFDNSDFDMVDSCEEAVSDIYLYTDLSHNGTCTAETRAKLAAYDPSLAEDCDFFVARDDSVCVNEATTADRVECEALINANPELCASLTDQVDKRGCEIGAQFVATVLDTKDSSECALLRDYDEHRREEMRCRVVLDPGIDCATDVHYDQFRRNYCGLE